MGSAFIVDAVRTPIGRQGGRFASVHAVELGAWPLRALLARTGIDPAAVQGVWMGCADPTGELGDNAGRTCALEAGFPVSVGGTQIDRREASGEAALELAAAMTGSGIADLVVAAGVGGASRVAAAQGPRVWPDELSWRFTLVPEGESADLLARRGRFERDALDAVAVRSHRRASAAAHAGSFDAELAPLVVDGREVRHDEAVRADVTVSSLGRLPAVFGHHGRHTAATSAAPADGSTAVLVASEAGLQTHGLRPLARIVATVTVGVDPTLSFTGPVLAARRALDQAGLQVDDLDLVEVHEAFAAVVLATEADLGLDPARVNVSGGALATGQTGGASGLMRLTTLVHGLHQRTKRYGLSLTAVGFGQATATLVERETL